MAARPGSRQASATTSAASPSVRSACDTGKLAPGNYVVSSRATNNAGETQVDKLKFNPAGYHNNVPQQIAVTVA